MFRLLAPLSILSILSALVPSHGFDPIRGSTVPRRSGANATTWSGGMTGGPSDLWPLNSSVPQPISELDNLYFEPAHGQPSNVIALRGQNIAFNCTASLGSPTDPAHRNTGPTPGLRIDWLKDGHVIPTMTGNTTGPRSYGTTFTSNRFTVSPTGQLTIEAVRNGEAATDHDHSHRSTRTTSLYDGIDDDQGTYQCLVTNRDTKLSILSRSAVLGVASLGPLLPPPTYSPSGAPFNNLELSVGQTAAFLCVTDSPRLPPPPSPQLLSVTWLKDGQVIDPRHLLRTLPSPTLPPPPALRDTGRENSVVSVPVSNGQILVIYHISARDSGIYKCKIEIPGEAEYSIETRLTVLPQDLSPGDLLKEPSFLIKPWDLTLAADHNTPRRDEKGSALGPTRAVVLPCVAVGHPNPRINWLKDGRELGSSRGTLNYSILAPGFLIIYDYSYRDSGVYTCRAQNTQDSTDASMTLQIYAFPKFLLKPEPVLKVRPNTDVTLICEATGFPKPRLVWYKDGIRLNDQERGDYIRIDTRSPWPARDYEDDDEGDSYRLSAGPDHVIPQRNGDEDVVDRYSEDRRSADSSHVIPGRGLSIDGDDSLLSYSRLHVLGTIKSDSGLYQCFAANHPQPVVLDDVLVSWSSSADIQTSTLLVVSEPAVDRDSHLIPYTTQAISTYHHLWPVPSPLQQLMTSSPTPSYDPNSQLSLVRREAYAIVLGWDLTGAVKSHPTESPPRYFIRYGAQKSERKRVLEIFRSPTTPVVGKAPFQTQSTGRVRLSNLTPDTTYIFELTAPEPLAHLLSAPPLVLRTLALPPTAPVESSYPSDPLESGPNEPTHSDFLVGTGSPRNISTVPTSSTSIYVSWMAPQEPLVQVYTLYVRRLPRAFVSLLASRGSSGGRRQKKSNLRRAANPRITRDPHWTYRDAFPAPRHVAPGTSDAPEYAGDEADRFGGRSEFYDAGREVIDDEDNDEEEEGEEMINVRSTSYHVSNLKPYTYYVIRIVAHTVKGPGPSSVPAIVRTYSDVPSAPPMNISLEPKSSSQVLVRWLAPPYGDRNGIISGFKIRYKASAAGAKGLVHTTDGGHHHFLLQGLSRGTEYLVRISALTINGSGVPSDWYAAQTYYHDLDESRVPDTPSSLDVRPLDNSIIVSWTPPLNQGILVRGYTMGYGIGVPDIFSQVLGPNERFYTIKNLKPSSEYVISLRAFNNQGNGRERLETVKTRSSKNPVSLMPPVGLKPLVLSPHSILLQWSDTTLAAEESVVEDRIYTIRYNSAAHTKYKYINSTQLNMLIEGLKPNTQYEFTVKVIRSDQEESTWSLSAFNTTEESPPQSPPRDLTVLSVYNDSSSVFVNWQPPRYPNGRVIGYLIYYTTRANRPDPEWVVEVVRGNRLTTVLHELTPNTMYHFKIQARNNKGYGPMSQVVGHHTPKGEMRFGAYQRHSLSSKDYKINEGDTLGAGYLLKSPPLPPPKPYDPTGQRAVGNVVAAPDQLEGERRLSDGRKRHTLYIAAASVGVCLILVTVVGASLLVLVRRKKVERAGKNSRCQGDISRSSAMPLAPKRHNKTPKGYGNDGDRDGSLNRTKFSCTHGDDAEISLDCDINFAGGSRRIHKSSNTPVAKNMGMLGGGGSLRLADLPDDSGPGSRQRRLCTIRQRPSLFRTGSSILIDNNNNNTDSPHLDFDSVSVINELRHEVDISDDAKGGKDKCCCFCESSTTNTNNQAAQSHSDYASGTESWILGPHVCNHNHNINNGVGSHQHHSLQVQSHCCCKGALTREDEEKAANNRTFGHGYAHSRTGSDAVMVECKGGDHEKGKHFHESQFSRTDSDDYNIELKSMTSHTATSSIDGHLGGNINNNKSSHRCNVHNSNHNHSASNKMAANLHAQPSCCCGILTYQSDGTSESTVLSPHGSTLRRYGTNDMPRFIGSGLPHARQQHACPDHLCGTHKNIQAISRPLANVRSQGGPCSPTSSLTTFLSSNNTTGPDYDCSCLRPLPRIPSQSAVIGHHPSQQAHNTQHHFLNEKGLHALRTDFDETDDGESVILPPHLPPPPSLLTPLMMEDSRGVPTNVQRGPPHLFDLCAGSRSPRPQYPKTQHGMNRPSNQSHLISQEGLADPSTSISNGQGGTSHIRKRSDAEQKSPNPTNSPRLLTMGNTVRDLQHHLQSSKQLQHPLKSFSIPSPPTTASLSQNSDPKGVSNEERINCRTNLLQQHHTPTQTTHTFNRGAPDLLYQATKRDKELLNTGQNEALLPKSGSSDDLNKEISNLEGIINDINAITTSDSNPHTKFGVR